MKLSEVLELQVEENDMIKKELRNLIAMYEQDNYKSMDSEMWKLIFVLFFWWLACKVQQLCVAKEQREFVSRKFWKQFLKLFKKATGKTPNDLYYK